MKGPLLLACNHPNSFFDAVLLGSMFKNPVHFLARGDVFRKPMVRKILIKLKMIPIYRLSEGREHLALNEVTFEQCQKILLEGGILLIFSEGLCIHQWGLRSLKKGTARIAIDAWAQPSIRQTFSVLPVSISYNSFSFFGKKIIIEFGHTLNAVDLIESVSTGEKIVEFNRILSDRLTIGLLHGPGNTGVIPFLIGNHKFFNNRADHLINKLNAKLQDAGSLEDAKVFEPLQPSYLLPLQFRKVVKNYISIIVLCIPAITGWMIHAPFFFWVRNLAKKKTTGTVFYDSVLFGLLFLLYPFYYLLIIIIGLVIGNTNFLVMLLLMPGIAWVLLEWRESLLEVINNFRMSKAQRSMLMKWLF